MQATAASSDNIPLLPALLYEGIQTSIRWHHEAEEGAKLSRTVQLFMPTLPNQDAQILISISNREGWKILHTLGILEEYEST